MPPLVMNLSIQGQHLVPVWLSGPQPQGILHPRFPSAGKKIAKHLWWIAAQKHIPTWLLCSLRATGTTRLLCAGGNVGGSRGDWAGQCDTQGGVWLCIPPLLFIRHLLQAGGLH